MSVELLPESEDHLQAVLSYELEQYKESNVLSALMKVLILQLQRVEDAFLDLQLQRFISTAFGYTLDLMGGIVGESRNFKNDNDYRTAIFIRALLNNGGGTPEDIISAIRILYDPFKIEYSEMYPANFSIFIQASLSPINSVNLIKSISPLGVKDFAITFSDENYPFTFAECSSEGADLRIDITNNVNDECDLIIIATANSEIFEVEADTILINKGYLGFAEIVINRTNLSLNGDDDVYYVEASNPLEMLLSYTDFDIIGGSKLAEVLKNG
jgi:hypothetical protein